MAQQTEVTADDVLKFWLDDCTPADWYKAEDAFDDKIRAQFGDAWENLCDGHYSLWLTYPSGALAYIILADQFSRNMFRGEGKAFASDRIALAAAKSAIDKGWDLRIDPPARQFFYMPLMHSENLCDQERCVRLMCERMNDGGNNLLHARAHREVIRKFGRFPYRNNALGRSSTTLEQSYVEDGGYRTTVDALEQTEAA
ncbi:DUF924 family protein [Pseudosulfitobacter pseudonitzschiae]|uniref:DUF924 family protein n=1 Tax=Pseudosulfitobacter pseudonitzschiae TaxID=1402135 RepID=UPI001AF4443C|nr:DUF924 family protein [Pseudosulfitobacter pseudonitzschiae]MBM1813465.1 DUF924 domain-containing protein [Pseudosulfitobacter pseudonitzschiae]MBM1830458.1 DUF924 domain-containing protein [Pseudosulfitobacter pseudonitzschiae]MBM1835325.1 DUF924 domain-containing protein [Pseudosulfitobacter pseudonitzschiae]MBM1840171.1 DUF924 domain-containing protein [Pseudosulfitobacter pseudonitzschiae]MBM1845841.1 DUF924 domain-containing protein [Pseudosulfitobacter pseudonitzschiae]